MAPKRGLKWLGPSLIVIGFLLALASTPASPLSSLASCPSSLSATSSSGASVTLNLVSPASEFSAIKAADPTGNGFSSYYWSQWVSGNYAQLPGAYTASDGGSGQPYSSGSHNIYHMWNLQVVNIANNFGVDGSTWISNTACQDTYGQVTTTTTTSSPSTTTTTTTSTTQSSSTSATTTQQTTTTTQTTTQAQAPVPSPQFDYPLLAFGIILAAIGSFLTMEENRPRRP